MSVALPAISVMWRGQRGGKCCRDRFCPRCTLGCGFPGGRELAFADGKVRPFSNRLRASGQKQLPRGGIQPGQRGLPDVAGFSTACQTTGRTHWSYGILGQDGVGDGDEIRLEAGDRTGEFGRSVEHEHEALLVNWLRARRNQGGGW